jgi:hypothetical protein
MTLSTWLWKLPKSTSKKQNIYNILLINMTQSGQIKQRYTFHLQRTTRSQIYFRFSSYLLRKPHLFVILTAIGWFIINIQSDLFWHRCLERQAFCTPRMYTLSPSKSIKGNFKSVHVSNLFWSREYNSTKEICKYPSFSKVGGNYPLDLKIIWSSKILIPK